MELVVHKLQNWACFNSDKNQQHTVINIPLIFVVVFFFWFTSRGRVVLKLLWGGTYCTPVMTGGSIVRQL